MEIPKHFVNIHACKYTPKKLNPSDNQTAWSLTKDELKTG